MKVLNLQCRHGHAFEGWFASHEDFESQRERGLLSCPVCNAAEVQKMPSAPRLNLGHSGEPTPAATVPAAPAQEVAQLVPPPLQAAWLKMVRQVMAQAEDVGAQFAQEARKIHHGEAEQRSIRGQASLQDTQALLEEGIEILPLPIPAGLKETLQ